MKKSYILIALAMVAALTMVSCKNNKKAKEPTQEEVQEMKQALADTVLAEIDRLTEQYYDASTKTFEFFKFGLTDAEKLVKPDYLLDPSVAGTLVTKTQKMNALAIYLAEMGIRMIYDMPQEETKEAIARLAVEVNHPIDMDFFTSEPPFSEVIKREYEICKERGDLAYFWQFQSATMCEAGYILSQDSELFFSKISEEQWQAFANQSNVIYMAIRKLANHDKEMATFFDMVDQTLPISDEEKAITATSIVAAKQLAIANKDKFIANRNALLQ